MKAEQPLTPWGDDPLSAFMSMADHNERACALKWPDVYEVLGHAHVLLKRIGEAVEKDPRDANLGAPRLLMSRSHSAILAGFRLAMSGQGVEAQAVLRAAIEDAWYALHVAKDPAPPARARIWWDRGDSPQATQACKDEFTVGKVRGRHEQFDAPTAAAMRHLYDRAIAFGAHPNQGGVASSLRMDGPREDAVKIGVGFLHPGTPMAAATLKAAVDVAVGVAKTAGLVYPERLRIAGVEEEVDRLVRRSVGVFSRFVRPESRAS